MTKNENCPCVMMVRERRASNDNEWTGALANLIVLKYERTYPAFVLEGAGVKRDTALCTRALG